MRLTMLENGNCCLNQPLVGTRKKSFTFCKSRKIEHLLPLASTDDGVTVNGTPEASTASNVEEMRVKLNQSLKGKDYTDGIVQALHEAARVLELALKEHSSLSKYSWFSTAWIGVDMSAWIKTLSYQVIQHYLIILSTLCFVSLVAARQDSVVLLLHVHTTSCFLVSCYKQVNEQHVHSAILLCDMFIIKAIATWLLGCNLR